MINYQVWPTPYLEEGVLCTVGTTLHLRVHHDDVHRADVETVPAFVLVVGRRRHLKTGLGWLAALSTRVVGAVVVGPCSKCESEFCEYLHGQIAIGSSYVSYSTVHTCAGNVALMVALRRHQWRGSFQPEDLRSHKEIPLQKEESRAGGT